MLKPKTLQNKSSWDNEKPTIIIASDSKEWNLAYEAWLSGKNPTSSPEWKKGIFLTFYEA
jgi:hypothetical protein